MKLSGRYDVWGVSNQHLAHELTLLATKKLENSFSGKFCIFAMGGAGGHVTKIGRRGGHQYNFDGDGGS